MMNIPIMKTTVMKKQIIMIKKKKNSSTGKFKTKTNDARIMF